MFQGNVAALLQAPCGHVRGIDKGTCAINICIGLQSLLLCLPQSLASCVLSRPITPLPDGTAAARRLYFSPDVTLGRSWRQDIAPIPSLRFAVVFVVTNAH